MKYIYDIIYSWKRLKNKSTKHGQKIKKQTILLKMHIIGLIKQNIERDMVLC